MRIVIVLLDDTFSEAIRDYVVRSFEFALDRFADRIREVRVRLADLNGPRGGEDKACSADVVLRTHGSLHVESTAEDLYSAVDRTALRLSRSVARHFDRERTIGRRAGHNMGAVA